MGCLGFALFAALAVEWIGNQCITTAKIAKDAKCSLSRSSS